jgi:hypothetical protein
MAFFGRWTRAEVLLLFILAIALANIALSIVTLMAPTVRKRLRQLESDFDHETSGSPSSRSASSTSDAYPFVPLADAVTVGACSSEMSSATVVYPLVGCLSTGPTDPCTGPEVLVGTVSMANSCDGGRLQLTVDLSASDSFVAGALIGVAYRADRFPISSDGCPITNDYYHDNISACRLSTSRTYCVDLQPLGLADRKSAQVALQILYADNSCPTGPSLVAHIPGGRVFATCAGSSVCDASPPACITVVPFHKTHCDS